MRASEEVPAKITVAPYRFAASSFLVGQFEGRTRYVGIVILRSSAAI